MRICLAKSTIQAVNNHTSKREADLFCRYMCYCHFCGNLNYPKNNLLLSIYAQ